MGKGVTVFKDIGKACKDLLGKDYDVGKTTVEVKSKTSSGVTFTPKATKSGDSVSGSLKAAYGLLPGLDCEATFGTKGTIDLSLEASELAKGLVLTAECATASGGKGLLSSANLIADYKTDAFTSKCSYDYYKADLNANVSTVYSALTCGLDCAYSAAKGTLSKYSAVCSLVQPEYIFTARCDDKGGKKTLGCSYYHKVSGDMQLGVSLAKPLAKSDVAIEFGCAYKLDKDTTVKAKVDSEGILCTSYKLKVNPMTSMTLAACVDTVNLSDNKHKFGLQLNVTP